MNHAIKVLTLSFFRFPKIAVALYFQVQQDLLYFFFLEKMVRYIVNNWYLYDK